MAVLTASIMVYIASLITGWFVPFHYLPSISPLLPLGGVAQGQLTAISSPLPPPLLTTSLIFFCIKILRVFLDSTH